ncbi:MAG TPA: DinB family protein [Ktedonobacterales bacterium]|jgi:DinB family protein|nr:DinB family protein [Ktedonobacterales bacterium]
MDIAYCRIRLRQSAAGIVALAEGATPEQARWKPTPEEWSLLEVICHLHDEEREDFRQRLDLILHHPDADWPPINPPGWVTERAYNQRDLQAMITAFMQERERSLTWLDSLSHPDWSAAHTHPIAGKMTAGDVLGAWVAHDHLHIRQLNQLHWQWLATQVDALSLEYAGGW